MILGNRKSSFEDGTREFIPSLAGVSHFCVFLLLRQFSFSFRETQRSFLISFSTSSFIGIKSCLINISGLHHIISFPTDQIQTCVISFRDNRDCFQSQFIPSQSVFPVATRVILKCKTPLLRTLQQFCLNCGIKFKLI